ncbi:MAG: hypothetical protein U5L96_09155 [Owenweeksia sp.]|nr:hypothetical protein [Owenweeksia sp.]
MAMMSWRKPLKKLAAKPRKLSAIAAFLWKNLWQNPSTLKYNCWEISHGNLVHLFERDCSVQRRFQKVVEVAPASAICKKPKINYMNMPCALASMVNYTNAGTAEFLVDKEENIFFIEVNPRIQVETYHY